MVWVSVANFLKKPRLALLGTGNIANFHVEAFKKAGFEITFGAATLNSKKIKFFAKKHSLKKIFLDPLDLFRNEKEWDFLLVSIPTEKNKDYLPRILQLGKPCLIEKPVSADFKYLSRFSKNDFPFIRVAYNRRFYSTIQFAKDFIKKEGPVYTCIQMPEIVKPAGNYTNVFNNSAHGIDLINYLFEKTNIAHKSCFSKDSGRLIILKSEKNDLINLVMNWNSPSNFQINIEAKEKRLELKPFEDSNLFEGMEVVHPTKILPVRRYLPRRTFGVSSFPNQKNLFKPGFLEQANEMKNILHGKTPKISASLFDAYKAQKMLIEILNM